MRFQALHAGAALTIVATSLLTACGGGSSQSTSTSPTTPNATKTIMGQLAVPQISGATAQGISLLATGVAVSSGQCPNLPDGYDPIASTVVNILDANDQKIGELTTDACGAFNTQVPDAASSLVVTPTGYKPLKSPVTTFTANNPAATASTPPANAKYVITSIQYVGNGAIAFTLTDDVTNKAVLGLPASAVSVQANQKNLTIKSLDTSLTKLDPASVMLVLDASGSMSSPVVAATATSSALTRFDLVSAASHLFLSGKQQNDETAFTIFAGNVTPINDAFLGTKNFVMAATNQPATYTISDSGFTTDATKLRPVADMYNPYNKIWGSSALRERHADDPYQIVNSRYDWGGSTALWSAASQGLDALVKRSNKRKLLIAMTDGQDNSSSSKSADLIQKAKNAGIPVHMIAFGAAGDVNETEMQAVASQTGGEYQRRADSSITDLFKSIQTGIRNQYTLQLVDTVNSGTVLTLSVQTGQSPVSRDVTAN